MKVVLGYSNTLTAVVQSYIKKLGGGAPLEDAENGPACKRLLLLLLLVIVVMKRGCASKSKKAAWAENILP